MAAIAPGLDHRHARPGEEETEPVPVGLAEKVVLAPGVGMRGAEFGIAQRADEGDHAADRPTMR